MSLYRGFLFHSIIFLKQVVAIAGELFNLSAYASVSLSVEFYIFV